MYVGWVRVLHKNCVASETSLRLKDKDLNLVLYLVLINYSENAYDLWVYVRTAKNQIPPPETIDIVDDTFYDHRTVHEVGIDNYELGRIFVRTVDAIGSKGVIRYLIEDPNIASLKGAAAWKVKDGIEEYPIVSSSSTHCKNVLACLSDDENITVQDSSKIELFDEIKFTTHSDLLHSDVKDSDIRRQSSEHYNNILLEYLKIRFGVSRAVRRDYERLSKLIDVFVAYLLKHGLDVLLKFLGKLFGA